MTPASRTSGVDPIDLVEPLAGGRLDGVGRTGPAAGVAEVGLGDLLLQPHVARVGGRGGLLGPRDVGVVGPLGGAERVVGHADRGPGMDGDLAALVRDLASLAARAVHGHRDERVRSARTRRRPHPGRRSASGSGASMRATAVATGRAAIWPSAGPAVPVGAAGALHRQEDRVLTGIHPEPDHRRRGAERRGTGSGRRQAVRRREERGDRGSGPSEQPFDRRPAPGDRRRVRDRPDRAGRRVGAAVNGSCDRVAPRRRGTESGVTVSRTSRGAGGRARRTSTRAAPDASPRIRPMARKPNSPAFTLRACPGPRPPASGRSPRASVVCDSGDRQLHQTATLTLTALHGVGGGW